MSNMSSSGMRRSKSVQDGRYSRMNYSNLPDPLGPFTPEADQALADADDARARSAYLRRELREAIDRTDKLQKAAHKSVNDGLTQKLSETVTLKVHNLHNHYTHEIFLQIGKQIHMYMYTCIIFCII